MRQYRIDNPRPKRPWRRRKRYTVGELRWLAKRYGWRFAHHKRQVHITRADGKPEAIFSELPVALPLRPAAEAERLAAFATLVKTRP